MAELPPPLAAPPPCVHTMEMVWLEGVPKQVIRWSIERFAQVRRVRGAPLRSRSVRMLDKPWILELYPGGTESSADGYVAVFLTKCEHFGNISPTLQVDFSIAVENQLNLGMTLRKVAPARSTFPGAEPVENCKARVGWADFMPWADLVDPGKGFQALGKVIFVCEMTPAGDGDNLVDVHKPGIDGSSLMHDITDLWRTKAMSDVTLRAEGGELVAHRALLAARSPVFRQMFSTEMMEAQSGVVELPDIRFEVLELLLEFLYTDAVARMDVEPQLIGDLFKAARKYDIPRLGSLCEAWALKCLAVDTAVDWLMLATMLGSERIRSACTRLIRSHFIDVQRTAGWQRLEDNKHLFCEVVSPMLAGFLADDQLLSARALPNGSAWGRLDAAQVTPGSSMLFESGMQLHEDVSVAHAASDLDSSEGRTAKQTERTATATASSVIAAPAVVIAFVAGVAAAYTWNRMHRHLR